VMLSLECHKFGDGAEIVAEMQIAGRLHAREDAGLGLGLLHCLALTPTGYGVAFAARQRLAELWPYAQAISISRICSAIETVRSAMPRCSRSTMRPSTTMTPFCLFSGRRNASMILRDHSTSSSVGENIWLHGPTWLG